MENIKVIVDRSDLVVIADAVRNKTKTSDGLPLSQIANMINNIETSGSSTGIEDVRYVTFMSHNGTAEYGKKAVAVGDDCADPIARGIFSTPTRESDVQYNYTFAGWSTEVNGGLDENALKAVIEDRTVYANFAAVLRSYTIKYYDGSTLLKTESLPYGATISAYTPEKDGYQFDSWSPAVPSVITGNLEFTAVWTEALTFANATWAQIAQLSESGDAPNVFSVGDEKTIAFNFNGTYENVNVRIIGFNHDDLADGSGKAGISMALSQAICGYERLVFTDSNDYETAPVNWESSKTRQMLNSGVIWTALPADLRGAIKSVTKTSNGIRNGKWNPLTNELYTTNDKVWLLSGTELGFDGEYSDSLMVAEGQGERYDFYSSVSSRIVSHNRCFDHIAGPTGYPTRSTNCKTNMNFVMVTYKGLPDSRIIARITGAASSDGWKRRENCPGVFGFCI